MNDFKNKIQRQRALEITFAMCNSYVKCKSIRTPKSEIDKAVGIIELDCYTVGLCTPP